MNKILHALMFCLAATLSLGTAYAKEPAKAPAASASASAASPQAKPADQLLDINSASEADLANLPKIGEARAKAIIKGRPYKGKDDLLRKKVISKDAYAAIKDQIIARQDGVKDDGKKDVKKDDKK
jgi:competence protein ComEA